MFDGCHKMSFLIMYNDSDIFLSQKYKYIENIEKRGIKRRIKYTEDLKLIVIVIYEL
jgi:hypothetical protein